MLVRPVLLCAIPSRCAVMCRALGDRYLPKLLGQFAMANRSQWTGPSSYTNSPKMNDNKRPESFHTVHTILLFRVPARQLVVTKGMDQPRKLIIDKHIVG